MSRITGKKVVGAVTSLFLATSMFMVGGAASAAEDPRLIGANKGTGSVVSADLTVNQSSIKSSSMDALRDIRSQMYNDPEVLFNGVPLKQAVQEAGLTEDSYVNGARWDISLENVALQRAYEQHLRWGHTRPDNTLYSTATSMSLLKSASEIITTEENIYTAIADVENGTWAGERDALIEANGEFNGENGHLHTLLNPGMKSFGFAQVEGMTVGWAHPAHQLGIGNTGSSSLKGEYEFGAGVTDNVLDDMDVTLNVPSRVESGKFGAVKLEGETVPLQGMTSIPVTVDATYISSNPKVLKITSDGIYEARSNGSVEIVATTASGKTFTATSTVFGGSSNVGVKTSVAYMSNDWKSLVNDIEYEFGKPGDEVIVGDWDGDGVDTLGIRSGNTFSLYNTHSYGKPDLEFKFGRVGDEVMVGDWDGNGTDTLGMRRGTNEFFLSDKLQGGNAEHEFKYGRNGDEIVVGNWNGTKNDTISVRRGKTFYIMNTLKGGNADVEYNYGRVGDEVLVGDFDGDGQDTITLRRGNTLYINNKHKGGNAERAVAYGVAGSPVFVGDWDGDGIDTPGGISITEIRN